MPAKKKPAKRLTQEELFPHGGFPYRLEYLDENKLTRLCWFQCEEHLTKHVIRYKITTGKTHVSKGEDPLTGDPFAFAKPKAKRKPRAKATTKTVAKTPAKPKAKTTTKKPSATKASQKTTTKKPAKPAAKTTTAKRTSKTAKKEVFSNLDTFFDS